MRSVREANEEVGSILEHDTSVDVENLESQVVVLRPCGDSVVPLEFIRFRRLWEPLASELRVILALSCQILALRWETVRTNAGQRNILKSPDPKTGK